MRNFLLGCCCGLVVGLMGAGGYSLAQQTPSQPWNPYAPGSWNSSTNLYNRQLDADTDAYLNQLKLQQLMNEQASQELGRQMERSMAERSGPTVGDAILQGLAEHGRAQTRALEAETAEKQRAVDRLNRELDKQEILDAIDRAGRGR